MPAPRAAPGAKPATESLFRALRGVAAGTLAASTAALAIRSFADTRGNQLVFPRPRGDDEPYAWKTADESTLAEALQRLAPVLSRAWAELRILAVLDPVPAMKAALTAVPPESRVRRALYDLVEAVCSWTNHPEARRWQRARTAPLAKEASEEWRDALRWAEVCLQVHAAWIPFAVDGGRAGVDPAYTLARAREAIARSTCYVRQADLLRGEPPHRWLGGLDAQGLPRTPLLFVKHDESPRVPVRLTMAWANPLGEHRPDLDLAFTREELEEMGLTWPDRNEVKRSVLCVESDAEGVHLVCQLGRYLDYATTHAAYGVAEPWHPKVRAMDADFVDADGRLRPIDGARRLENHFGVSTAILSSNGHIVHLRQSRGALVSRDLVVPASSGGCSVDVEGDPGGTARVPERWPDAPDLRFRFAFEEPVGDGLAIDPTRDARRESWEEVAGAPMETAADGRSRRKETLAFIRPLAVVRDALRAGKPEILYVGYLDFPVEGVTPSIESKRLVRKGGQQVVSDAEAKGRAPPRHGGRMVTEIDAQKEAGVLVTLTAPTTFEEGELLSDPSRLVELVRFLEARPRTSGKKHVERAEGRLADELKNGRGVATRVSHFTMGTLHAYALHAEGLPKKK